MFMGQKPPVVVPMPEPVVVPIPVVPAVVVPVALVVVPMAPPLELEVEAAVQKPWPST
jgi:hypothetical protein